jgi:hypothetical protein
MSKTLPTTPQEAREDTRVHFNDQELGVLHDLMIGVFSDSDINHEDYSLAELAREKDEKLRECGDIAAVVEVLIGLTKLHNKELDGAGIKQQINLYVDALLEEHQW